MGTQRVLLRVNREGRNERRLCICRLNEDNEPEVYEVEPRDDLLSRERQEAEDRAELLFEADALRGLDFGAGVQPCL
jgi:hypothetical protein